MTWRRGYATPELRITGGVASNESDVHPLALTMWCGLSSTVPYPDPGEKNIQFVDVSKVWKLAAPPRTSPDCSGMLLRCMDCNAKRRSSASVLLNGIRA